MGRRSQAHRGADIAAVLGASWKRQAEQALAAAGFVLAQRARAKWVAFMDPHDIAPEIFSAQGEILSLPLPRWCELARAWSETRRYGIGCMTQLIRYEAALHARCKASTVDGVKDIRDQGRGGGGLCSAGSGTPN